MGSAASSVEPVWLDPELKCDLLLHAAAEHVSVSEAIGGLSAGTCAPANGSVLGGLLR